MNRLGDFGSNHVRNLRAPYTTLSSIPKARRGYDIFDTNHLLSPSYIILAAYSQKCVFHGCFGQELRYDLPMTFGSRQKRIFNVP